MPNEPHWPSPEALIEINADEVAQTGEPHRLLSPALLESAWAKPISRWAYEGETDVLRLAISLMAGLAQNHPFQQGNKRTAFQAGLLLLEANGWTLTEAADTLQLADDFVRLIEHTVDEEAFVALVRPHVVRFD